MKPRYYQVNAEKAVFDYFIHNPTGNPLVAMPTGTGKSLVIAMIAWRILSYPGQRVLMLTHVQELIEQNMAKLLAIWPSAPAGIYSAGIGRRDLHFPITYAGIASVAKKAASFGKINIIMIDEAHMVSANDETMYKRFIAELLKVNPYLRVIGLTATPYRQGMGMLTEGGLFTDICYDDTGMDRFNVLLSEGYLAPLIPKATKVEYDVADVKVTGGEYNQVQLQEKVDQEQLTRDVCAELVESAYDRAHWLVFAAGIQHAEHVTACLNQIGVPAAVVHSKSSSEDRDKLPKAFAAGKFRALVNNGVFTTGYDFPELDCIAVLRPTKSTSLWVQMLGRGTRPAPGKENCLVLDFAGNTRRLGPINDPVLPRPKGTKGGGEAPVKQCPQCATWNHASATKCIHCGHEFPRVLALSLQASIDDLIKKAEPPIIERFEVTKVVYTRHQRREGTPSLKVSYYSGIRRFEEWVCVEHTGFVKHKANRWWADRSYDEPPETVDEALQKVDALKTPKAIAVHLNRKFPEIVDYEWPLANEEAAPSTVYAGATGLQRLGVLS